MPFYSYFCKKCEQEFDVFMRISEFDEERNKQKCPECGSKKVAQDIAADWATGYAGYTTSLADCKTLGRYAELNRKKYGNEKSDLMEKSFETKKEYKDNLSEGMTRVHKGKDFRGKDDR